MDGKLLYERGRRRGIIWIIKKPTGGNDGRQGGTLKWVKEVTWKYRVVRLRMDFTVGGRVAAVISLKR